MLGIIQVTWQDFIVSTYGEEVWQDVLKEANIDTPPPWVSSCPYADSVIVGYAPTHMGS